MVQKKQIVIINQDSGYLMVDIANAFAVALFEVTLVTGRLIQRNTPLNSKVRICRIIPYKRNNFITRLATWIFGAVQILLLVKIRFRKKRLLIVSNPPFAPLIPLIVNNPFSLLIYDIYPEVLTNMGILSISSCLVKWWQIANRKVYSKAQKVFTLTEGMKTVLEKKAVIANIEVVPIWADKTFFKMIPKQENKFIKKQGLEKRFIVMYSGNLGKTHPVEIMIDIAQKINNPKVFIIIIGGGEKYQLMKEKLSILKLDNIRLLPLQSIDMLPYTMNAADLGVVSLETKASDVSIPSKIFSMIAAGLPILGIGGEQSELNNMIGKHDIGKCFIPQKIDEICLFINELANNHTKKDYYSKNAIKSSEFYTNENAKRFLDV